MTSTQPPSAPDSKTAKSAAADKNAAGRSGLPDDKVGAYAARAKAKSPEAQAEDQALETGKAKTRKSKKDKSKSDDEKVKRTKKQIIVEELKFVVGLAAFILVFFNLVFGHYKIPSESMQPTLEVGDHLYVSKFAYGYSRHSLIFGMHKLPFLKDGRILTRMPKRGDVVVFRNPRTDVVMIKRLVGLPGDKVQTVRGRLYLNENLIERNPVETFYYREHRGMVQQVTEFSEQLPGEKQPHNIYERNDIGWLDNTGPFIVPEGHFFFMGDNRDNSEDSRAPSGPNSGGPGLVPLDYLIGRADMMVYSLKRCEPEEGLKCPGFRAFKPL